MQASLFDAIEQERRSMIDWRPETPPCLDGITDIELDCETTGLRWWDGDLPVGIALGLPNGKTYYLPYAHRGGGNLDEAVVKRWANRELRNKRITNLNTRFDIHQLFGWGIDLEEQGCEVSDVGHYAALLDDHRRSFSLESISRDYLGEGKEDIEDPSKISEMHAFEVEQYARRDVELIYKLKKVMWPLLDEQELQQVRQLEDELIFAVCEMERNAAPIDMELLENWEFQSRRELSDLHLQIFHLTGMQIAPGKRTHMAKLFHELHLEPGYTEEGNISFDADVLKKYKDHPVIQLVIEARNLENLRNKYITSYYDDIEGDGLLRYALHQLRTDEGGTISGRFSSSKLLRGNKKQKSKGKNIQQVFAVEKQKERFGDKFIVRQLFVPEQGKWLIAADAAQIEYRIFASMTGSKKILKRYKDDPTVSYHKMIWELVKPYKADIQYKPVKNLNFAKIYGAGRNKVADMLELPRHESDKFVNLYDKMFPEAAALLNQAAHIAKKRGYIKTILGRRARFPEGKRLHKALNSAIQGGAADIMKLKLIELAKERKKLGLTMRMTVHDEFVGDVPDIETAYKVSEILNFQSEAFASKLKVPILWDLAIGRNWMECECEIMKVA
jgi:DNA polymerase-1